MIATTDVSPETLILQHMKDNGQKLSWLAEKIGLSKAHLFLVLKGEGSLKRDLTAANLRKINDALRTDFKS